MIVIDKELVYWQHVIAFQDLVDQIVLNPLEIENIKDYYIFIY